MSAFLWWRSWHGAPMDHKYPVIAAKAGVKVGIVSAVMWALLDYASQHKTRGNVDGFDVESYAVYTGFAENEVLAVINAMVDKKMIVDNRLANWEKRQPKREDDSAERVRNWRNKKRSVTQGNDEDEKITIDSSLLSLSLSNSNNNDSSLNLKPNAFSIYEKEIGVLTPSIADTIGMELDENPEGWVEDAIVEASKNNHRSMKYIQGILRNWREKGRVDQPKPPAQRPTGTVLIDVPGVGTVEAKK